MNAVTPADTRGPPRQWHRFTPAQRLARFTVYLVVVAAVLQSARTVQVIPEFLLDAPEQMQDLLKRMWPIAWSHYPQGVHDALVDTLQTVSVCSMPSERACFTAASVSAVSPLCVIVTTPGQLGPISRVFDPCIARLARTMSLTGMPSVMHTTSSMPPSAASRIASAA